MGFYIRKSISAGPFRFNLSKSGVGLSVGVKGLRVGTGPRGHYVHAGLGGIYYRASLGRAGERHTPARLGPEPAPALAPLRDGAVAMIEISSGDVMAMRDATRTELLDDINDKQRRVRMSLLLGGSGLVLGVIAGLAIGGNGLGLASLAIPGYLIGAWFDSFRRVAVVYYDLDASVAATYESVAATFDNLARCAGIWHIEASGAVRDLTTWKRNAGATSLIRRRAATASYQLPSVLKCNVTPPAVRAGRRTIFFMPDFALIQDGSQLGSVGYADLRITWRDSRFIEEATVPSDALVVDRTWQHPNKGGGPDRRFKNNRQLPVCLYETALFTSASGVNELLEFSKSGVVKPFADALEVLSRSPALPSSTSRSSST